MREDVREDVKMSRCERRCEDEKMFYRPPLLEEPCAQTLSGIKIHNSRSMSDEPALHSAAVQETKSELSLCSLFNSFNFQ